MPTSLDLTFTEIISEVCSCEDGDYEQKVILKVWGLCCYSSATKTKHIIEGAEEADLTCDACLEIAY